MIRIRMTRDIPGAGNDNGFDLSMNGTVGG
jgi:hypothetical protein